MLLIRSGSGQPDEVVVESIEAAVSQWYDPEFKGTWVLGTTPGAVDPAMVQGAERIICGLREHIATSSDESKSWSWKAILHHSIRLVTFDALIAFNSRRPDLKYASDFPEHADAVRTHFRAFFRGRAGGNPLTECLVIVEGKMVCLALYRTDLILLICHRYTF